MPETPQSTERETRYEQLRHRAVFLETHNWGRAAKFFQALGYELVATRGTEVYGICSNPFIEYAFQTIEYRIKVYRALTASYRQLETPDPLVSASEYIIQHSDRDAERSLTRSSLMSFIHERGKGPNPTRRRKQHLPAR